MSAPTVHPQDHVSPAASGPELRAPESDLHATMRAELTTRFAERRALVERYGPDFVHLWQLTAEQAQGGKLVRPLLLVEAHTAMSEATGRSWASREQVLTLASALELLHFAFLLHDDVIDGDLYRRGHLNLVGTLSAEQETGRAPRDGATTPSPEGLHWGQSGAILAGNLLLSQVHQVFARIDVPLEVRERLLDLLDLAITETVAGEHSDVALSDRVAAPDLETILATAVHKTATYSFALPLRLAAVLADAPPAWEERLDTTARHLGLAFQLQDDYLSTFGDAARHGKDPLSDLREGKETAIIAFARLTSAWSRVRDCFGNRNVSEESARRAVEALRECGADRFVLGLVAEHREALGALLADDGAARPFADDGPRRARGMLGDTEPLRPASGTASWGTASSGTASSGTASSDGASSAPPLPPRLRALLGALDAELVGRQS